MLDLDTRQKIEIDFWRDSPTERPEADSIHNLVNKVSDAGVLLDALARHAPRLTTKGRVLELGAGQGWASCVYKRLHPGVHATVTDISEHAIRSLPKWERLYGVSVERAYACRSHELEEVHGSIDQVFCFAAAHHFVTHRRTLREIARVLKPGGRAFYFHEPATSELMYGPALRRVNRNRPEVPEDVLVPARLHRLAAEVGLDLLVDHHPSLRKRGPVETLYYAVLGKLPVLQRVLPCTAHFVFTKPAGS